MVTNLIVIGTQKAKLEQTSKGFQKRLMLFLDGAKLNGYDSVTAVIRTQRNADGFLSAMANDGVASDGTEIITFPCDQVINVPGFDIDCSRFRLGEEYHLCGISTAASVLTMAMSMHSAGLNVKVLSKYCEDRKGDRFHKYALEIMNAYMPGHII